MDKNTRNTRMGRLHALEERRTLPVFVKYGLIAVAVIVAVIIGLLIYFNVTGGYVATVNGQKIKTGEFKYFLEIQKQTMYQSALETGANIDEETFWATPIGGNDAVEVAKTIALNSLKEMKLQYIKAKDAKILMTDDEIKNLENNIQTDIIDKMGEGNKIKANKAFIAEYGFSIDDLKNAQIQNYTVQKYWSVEMTDEDANVDTHYSKNPDWYKEDTQFRTGAQEAVWARHILIPVDAEATQQDKDAAKKKAEDLITKLKGGADFAALAVENSEDPGSKDRGGDYVFGKGQMYPELEKAAFELKPGEISSTPLLTTSGYHILKLEEKYAKGEPVSLKCANEYYEYGINFVKYKLITDIIAGWVKDVKYEENTVVLSSIS